MAGRTKAEWLAAIQHSMKDRHGNDLDYSKIPEGKVLSSHRVTVGCPTHRYFKLYNSGNLVYEIDLASLI